MAAYQIAEDIVPVPSTPRPYHVFTGPHWIDLALAEQGLRLTRTLGAARYAQLAAETDAAMEAVGR